MSSHRGKPAGSRYLSWILRHRVPGGALALDQAGWVSVDALLRFTRLSREELESIVERDKKQRFQLIEEKIRACQGHSLDSGVTHDALEASWTEYVSQNSIWHGTTLAALERIANEGLLPGSRTHVHCAPAPDSIVGKRAGSQVLLEISPAAVRAHGFKIFAAPNGVILARQIPRDAIVKLAGKETSHPAPSELPRRQPGAGR